MVDSLADISRYRWLLDPDMDLQKIAGVVHGQPAKVPPAMLQPRVSLVPHRVGGATSPPQGTRTLDPKIIHHQAMAKLKLVLNHVRTVDDLQNLSMGLDNII
jgi:hypothetical protein